ncbi:aldo/keto reductase, partial [Salmonella enterica subsp. enterica]|nr:aldo/keto reductase [Salmonella enterica subsp. enterica]
MLGQIIPEFTLNDGMKLPVVGLGTYTLRGSEGV